MVRLRREVVSHIGAPNDYNARRCNVIKHAALFSLALLALSAQAPGSAGPTRHLVYEFGYNTPAAKSGQGTGTMTVDISGPVADGGLMVTASDHWWNTVRPRAANTCEVYADGKVNCSQRPYSI